MLYCALPDAPTEHVVRAFASGRDEGGNEYDIACQSG